MPAGANERTPDRKRHRWTQGPGRPAPAAVDPDAAGSGRAVGEGSSGLQGEGRAVLHPGAHNGQGTGGDSEEGCIRAVHTGTAGRVAGVPQARAVARVLEAAVGIEPTMEVLQTSALPLGYAASARLILL